MEKEKPLVPFYVARDCEVLGRTYRRGEVIEHRELLHEKEPETFVLYPKLPPPPRLLRPGVVARIADSLTKRVIAAEVAKGGSDDAILEAVGLIGRMAVEDAVARERIDGAAPKVETFEDAIKRSIAFAKQCVAEKLAAEAKATWEREQRARDQIVFEENARKEAERRAAVEAKDEEREFARVLAKMKQDAATAAELAKAFGGAA